MSDDKQKYANSVKRQLKQGKLPEYHFAKDGDKLERSKELTKIVRRGRVKYVHKLTWRTISTFKELTK